MKQLTVAILMMVSTVTFAQALEPKDTSGKLMAVDNGLASKDACITNTLTCNSTVEGTLTADDCALGDGTVYDEWQFNGGAGQVVDFSLTSADFDTFLFLLDPILAIFAVDDDSGPGTNSRITTTLDETGTWSIWANNFFPATGDAGDYTLSLECTPLSPIEIPTLSAVGIATLTLLLAAAVVILLRRSRAGASSATRGH